MATSIVDADTLLAIDVGSITTRAFFFDTVSGTYRMVAVGTSPSTYGPPVNDASEGVRLAIRRLQEVARRDFIGLDQVLIQPSNPEGSGVDTVAATVSAVSPLKIVAVGLVEDVSVESARNLAASTYGRLVDTFSMNDRRSLSKKIDELLALRPDLVIIAGGTENGAARSVIKMLDPIGLSTFLMPLDQRPALLFVGNPEIAGDVREALGEITKVATAPNLRPMLDLEQLGPGEGQLRTIFRRVHSDRNPGVQELDAWTSGRLLPSASGFGRMIQFISQHEPKKGVLGIDLGASSTVVAAGLKGSLVKRVYSPLGMGPAMSSFLRQASLRNVVHWMAEDVSEDDVRDYVIEKTIHPHSLPFTEQEAALELALAREVIRVAMRDARRHFPAQIERIGAGLIPTFEPIILAGSTLTNAYHHGASMLAVLDAVEPVGVTVLLSDENGMLSALGAAAEINPVLPVQVLDSGVLKSWGTVIAPTGRSRFGTPVLRLRAEMPSGEEKRMDIKQGQLVVIPLDAGQKAKIHLQPVRGVDVGLGGPGRSGSINVVGGEMGIVIDARGRPLRLSNDPARRQDLLKKWLYALTG